MMHAYFFSYVFQTKAPGSPPQFGCSVTREEHPVYTVKRWNEENTTRTTVLLHFQMIDDRETGDTWGFDFETRHW